MTALSFFNSVSGLDTKLNIPIPIKTPRRWFPLPLSERKLECLKVAFQGYTKMTRYKDCGVLTLQKSMKAKW
jgi:hypothetical protein